VSDPLRDLERQVEQGNLFAHAEMTKQASRANESDALLNGLVGLLVRHKVVDADELMAIVEAARPATEQNVSVAVRTDEDLTEPTIDCASRLPVCKAACCRLHFALSIDEIESGLMKWELGHPYFNRHNDAGYCHQWEGGCTIYDERPNPCRVYSCEHDERIWKDFDAMELNHEWIATYLDKRRSPVELFMDTIDRP
jgi:Fe-S-cluster containining protein